MEPNEQSLETLLERDKSHDKEVPEWTAFKQDIGAKTEVTAKSATLRPQEETPSSGESSAVPDTPKETSDIRCSVN